MRAGTQVFWVLPGRMPGTLMSLWRGKVAVQNWQHLISCLAKPFHLTLKNQKVLPSPTPTPAKEKASGFFWKNILKSPQHRACIPSRHNCSVRPSTTGGPQSPHLISKPLTYVSSWWPRRLGAPLLAPRWMWGRMRRWVLGTGSSVLALFSISSSSFFHGLTFSA